MQEILSVGDVLTLRDKFKNLSLRMYRIDFHPESRSYICYIPGYDKPKGYGESPDNAYHDFLAKVTKFLNKSFYFVIANEYELLKAKMGPEVVSFDRCIQV